MQIKEEDFQRIVEERDKYKKIAVDSMQKLQFVRTQIRNDAEKLSRELYAKKLKFIIQEQIIVAYVCDFLSKTPISEKGKMRLATPIAKLFIDYLKQFVWKDICEAEE